MLFYLLFHLYCKATANVFLFSFAPKGYKKIEWFLVYRVALRINHLPFAKELIIIKGIPESIKNLNILESIVYVRNPHWSVP